MVAATPESLPLQPWTKTTSGTSDENKQKITSGSKKMYSARHFVADRCSSVTAGGCCSLATGGCGRSRRKDRKSIYFVSKLQ
jgi:hypothetical protein